MLFRSLSRVEVICKADAAAAIDAVRAAWGKITKIEFIGAPTSIKYDMSGATPTVSSEGTPVNFTLLKNYNDAANTFAAIDIPEKTNDVVDACAMLYPIAPTANESFKLKITTAGATNTGAEPVVIEETINVNLNNVKAPMVKGKIHQVTLTFKVANKQIVVNASTIDNWELGNSGTNDVNKN